MFFVSTSVTILLLILKMNLIDAQLTWRMVHRGGAVYAPSVRCCAGIGYESTRNVIVLFGGKTADGILGDTWIYDLSSNNWREVITDLRPPSRYNFVSGMSLGFFYVSTGVGPSSALYGDFWRFNIETEVWEELPAQRRPYYYTSQQWQIELQQGGLVEPAFRGRAAGGIFHNATRFHISFGFSDKMHADLFSYDIDEMSWYKEFGDIMQYSPKYPHARHSHASVMVSESQMLVYGGCQSGGGSGGDCPSDDFWLYDAKRKDWTSLEGCASPRTKASLAMLPMKYGQRRVVLYGGVENSSQIVYYVKSPKDQVAVFDIDAQEWSLRRAIGEVPNLRSSAAMTTGPDGVLMFGGYDLESKSLTNDLHILHGNAYSVDRAAIQSECKPTFFNLIALHSVLMALGWGFFLQWGAFIARYLTHEGSFWLNLHILFQVFGLLLVLAGFITAIISVRSHHFQFVHAILGLVVMILGIIQPINGLLRPQISRLGEKLMMRSVWGFIHKALGYTTLTLAICNISLGLFLTHAHAAIWLAWYVYVGLVIFIHFAAELYRLYKIWRSASGAQYNDLHGDTYLDLYWDKVASVRRRDGSRRSFHLNAGIVR